MLRRLDQLPQFQPLGRLRRPRLCPSHRPLGQGPGVSLFWFLDTGRHGPARDVTSRVTASRRPCRADVTRGRDHHPLALPPGPLPNRFPLLGVRRCSRAHTGGCQGLRALTQRSPRSGRFTAMRFQTREVHCQVGDEGLLSRLTWNSPKLWRSCAAVRARVYIIYEIIYVQCSLIAYQSCLDIALP